MARRIKEQYAFVYHELAACRIHKDRQRLESSLDLLSYQRETWKLASEQVDSEPSEAKAPTMPHISMDTAQTSPGFSLEA